MDSTVHNKKQEYCRILSNLVSYNDETIIPIIKYIMEISHVIANKKESELNEKQKLTLLLLFKLNKQVNISIKPNTDDSNTNTENDTYSSDEEGDTDIKQIVTQQLNIYSDVKKESSIQIENNKNDRLNFSIIKKKGDEDDEDDEDDDDKDDDDEDDEGEDENDDDKDDDDGDEDDEGEDENDDDDKDDDDDDDDEGDDGGDSNELLNEHLFNDFHLKLEITSYKDLLSEDRIKNIIDNYINKNNINLINKQRLELLYKNIIGWYKLTSANALISDI